VKKNHIRKTEYEGETGKTDKTSKTGKTEDKGEACKQDKAGATSKLALLLSVYVETGSSTTSTTLTFTIGAAAGLRSWKVRIETRLG
jgi:hypothetical protein